VSLVSGNEQPASFATNIRDATRVVSFAWDLKCRQVIDALAENRDVNFR